MAPQPSPSRTVGLYVHLPWCVKKCPYCDFNSHELHSSLREHDYIETLLRDLALELSRTRATVNTVYFGGGTPSLFQPASFERILNHPALAHVQEVTMEANPGVRECGAFESYRAAGINRVSIGVQSLHDASLRKLGRIHSAADARVAVQQALTSGLRSVNVDMMYGLPDQTFDMAMHDLDALIDLEPTHISWYQLTIEPNTLFSHRPPTLASDDVRADISDAGLERLTAAGYRQYEVSAYAKPGFKCCHNLNYWRFGDYLGIGAGAHGKVTLNNGSIVRTQKTRRPETYLDEVKTSANPIKRAELPVEFMMNALRLCDGVDTNHFSRATGLASGALEPTLSNLRAEGLMRPDRLALTAFGFNYLNSVIARFL